MKRALPPARRPLPWPRFSQPETRFVSAPEGRRRSATRAAGDGPEPRPGSRRARSPVLLSIPTLLLAALLPAGNPLHAQQEEGGTAEGGEIQEAAPEEPRATFNVALDAARGGGRVIGSAGDYELQPGRLVIATGGVTIKYKDLTLQAEQMRLDIPSNRVTAEGNVILDEGPERLSGQYLEYDLDSRTGRITQARAEVDPGYFFSGAEIEKIGEQTFTVEKGIFTSCEQEVPSWSFAMSKASITIEEYARIRNARLRFKRLPVLYFPYVIWPATTERASGFLIPKPGYSDRLGAHISMAYFKTLGRSADMTIFGDFSTEEYNGLGLQYRYRPSEGTKGIFEGYYRVEPGLDGLLPSDFPEDDLRSQPTQDPDFTRGDDRWKLIWGHESNELWDRFRGVVNLELYSDFDYLRDVERNFDRRSRPFSYSNAYLSRNWGAHSFNAMVDLRELVNANGGRSTFRQLPEIEYKIRSTRIGSTSMYFDLESSANYFSVDFEDPPPADPTQPRETTTLDYGRFD
ncbi:MAG: LPS assembly protein LptD, partial [Holophagales bacterium]|nr:LPS assembly protein LptD [Holophagales bacterium]